jgi:small-conductance mechanosensitive channel
MKPDALTNLLSDFWADVNDYSNPGLLWQVLTILVCLAAGSAIARVLRAGMVRQQSSEDGKNMMKLGMSSFLRVLSPLLGLVLIELSRPTLARYHHVHVVQVFIPLIASFVIMRTAFYVIRRIATKKGQDATSLLMVEKIVSLIVWIGVVLYISGWWPDIRQFLDESELPIGAHRISLLTILQGTGSVAVTLVFALWLGAVIEERLLKLDSMHSSLRVVLARAVRSALVLIAVLVSLSLVGIDLTVLSVFGGALGVGLGFGLQKIASSYVSGFVVLLERSLSIGDIVSFDKYYGIVTHINTRYTVLQGLDGIETVVPNDVLIAGPIQNMSLTDSTLRLATTVTVAYSTDLDTIMKLMEAAAGGVPRVLELPAPQVVLSKFGTNGFDLELGFWINDPQNGRSGVTSDVNRAIWRVLKENNVELPSPQRDIRLINAEDLAKTLNLNAKSPDEAA